MTSEFIEISEETMTNSLLYDLVNQITTRAESGERLQILTLP